MRLSPRDQSVLVALAGDAFLKSHRYLDGTKDFRLQRLDGSVEEVSRETVETLLQRGLVTSNQKFPAATFMLTPKGRELAHALAHPNSE